MMLEQVQASLSWNLEIRTCHPLTTWKFLLQTHPQWSPLTYGGTRMRQNQQPSTIVVSAASSCNYYDCVHRCQRKCLRVVSVHQKRYILYSHRHRTLVLQICNISRHCLSSVECTEITYYVNFKWSYLHKFPGPGSCGLVQKACPGPAKEGWWLSAQFCRTGGPVVKMYRVGTYESTRKIRPKAWNLELTSELTTG